MTAPAESRVALSGWCGGPVGARPQHDKCRNPEQCGCPCHDKGGCSTKGCGRPLSEHEFGVFCP